MHPRCDIIYVIGSLDVGGAEKQVALLARRIAERGLGCGVFTLQEGGFLKPDLLRAKIPVWTGGLQKGDMARAPWKIVPAQIVLHRAIRKTGARIVHAFLPITSFMGALAGRLANRWVVTSRRGLGFHKDRIPLFVPLDFISNLLSHRITANSLAVREDLLQRERIGSKRIVVIYNGIDIGSFRTDAESRRDARKRFGFDADMKVVSVVANLIGYKGHEDLIRAARSVVVQVPKVKFVLAGNDAGIGPRLRQLASEFGLRGHIEFIGQCDDVPALLAASDMSVLSSHEEGFSNVILESMAAGIPVVATAVGGNVEAIVDGRTGWLVPPRSPGMLAEKITDLLVDEEKANRWGEAARRRAAHVFDADRMVEAHLGLYQSLGGCKTSGARAVRGPGSAMPGLRYKRRC